MGGSFNQSPELGDNMVEIVGVNKFALDSIVVHRDSNRKYIIEELPDRDKRLEHNGSMYYRYRSIEGHTTGQVWIRSKGEMEDGRFIRFDEWFEELI